MDTQAMESRNGHTKCARCYENHLNLLIMLNKPQIEAFPAKPQEFQTTMNNYCLGKVPTNELQIYTWKDATLKELTSLVREVNPDSRRKGTFFDFALIYPSPSSRGNYQRSVNQFIDYQQKDIGTTVSGRKGVDDSKVCML